MANLTVGAGMQYATIAEAVAASQDGDVIQVSPGTYTNDFATINTKITIEGMGGMVDLVATVSPPDGKAILTINNDATLINMSFSGAAVPDGNGAGIRYQAGNLLLEHDYFHNNENGLLSAANPSGSITILDSEFANNGSGNGLTHNLYIGEIGTLTVRDSLFLEANVGHDIKSRALNNIIEGNTIVDGPNGDASYEIDLPNGGNAIVNGNTIEKGPNAQNPFFISFGEEGGIYPGSTLTISDNVILNDNSSGDALVHDFSGGAVTISDNQFWGLDSAHFYNGNGTPTVSGNTFPSAEPTYSTAPPYLPVLDTACFLRGTRIATPDGEVAVEKLRPGDAILIRHGEQRGVDRIKWIGHRRIVTMRHPRPDTVTPVRIARGAIADGVPRRDLMVSQDHALYFDGVLIVARQLLNGTSIRLDLPPPKIYYYHIEMESHAILFAEGMPAETWLDTGGRGVFDNGGAPLVLHPDLAQANRISLSCVPLRDDAAAVWPIWRRIADRAVQLGWRAEELATTTDPDLCLRAGDILLRGTRPDSNRHLFALSGGCDQIRLLSRAARPTECRPWLEDRRRLGARVRRILIHAGTSVGELPLDHPSLGEGWWQPEDNGQCRWTDGDAVLRLPTGHSPLVLDVELCGDMIYPLESDTPWHDAEHQRRTA